MKFRIALLVFGCFVFASSTPGTGNLDAAAGEAKPKTTLEEAYRKWHKGFGSKKREDREAVLRSMLPNQKDIDFLLPKQSKDLGPLLAKGTALLIENVDNIADEITKSGEIKSVKTNDVRAKDPEGRCKRLFEIIPKEVPVFDMSVSFVNGDGSGSEFYVYLHGRWVWISGLDRFPEILDKMK